MMNSKSLFDLKGRTAIVTGAALGIGREIANLLGEYGAQVALVDVNVKDGQAAEKELQKAGHDAVFIKADISQVAEIERTVSSVVKRYGRLDILVNNAGIFPFSSMLETSEELWDKVMAINLKGTFFFSQKAAKSMVDSGKGGRIINIASIDAYHPTGNLVHYDTSKGGVVMMTKSMAYELAKYGIVVNGVAPGGIATPGAAQSAETMMKALKLNPEDYARMTSGFTARIPMGRQGEPADIAAAVLFLASDAASYITGETIIVDGGYLLS
jgi:2-deoxy-D-gluconate 3-dehydrogenase